MPHLKLLDKAGNRAYRVDAADAVVGRDPSCAVVLQGEGTGVVSSRHARLVLEDGSWWVEDLGSRNGTFLNARRLTTAARQKLNPGDEISFGGTGPKLFAEEVVGRALASTISEIPASEL